jgi:hypothetical protein
MDAINEEALELLRSALRALEPWPDRFVVVGGWAMQIYRYLDGADSSVAVAHTKDVDIAVASRTTLSNELPRSLQAEGFIAVRSRATEPAKTYFQAERHGDDELAQEHLEFLVPLVGGSDRHTVEIAPGVGAETVRYLDLSFEQVVSVNASQIPFLTDLGDLKIRVPSPASFLLAKALVYEKRKHDEKRDSDCANIYWLARVTRSFWPDVRRDLEALDVLSSWRLRGYTRLRQLFESTASDGVIRAARSIADRDHDEKVVYAVMRRFLAALGVC